MGPMNLDYDFRDIFRAPRLALSGKKIWIFIVGNLGGFILYWISSYLSISLSGISFNNALAEYGLYPCLYGNEAEWYSWLIYYAGISAWVLVILFSCTAVSRVTLKQLKGNDFFSSGDAWSYVFKHWHAIVFSPIAVTLIIAFFILFAAVFAFICSIPAIGEFLFVVPYIIYFFGSIFTIYSLIVFFVSILYTPAIVGVYEEDTMGTVFNSYSITIGHAWRIVLYHLLLLPLLVLGLEIFSWFSMNSIGFINYIFGCEWFMGSKLTNITNYASSLVCPQWMCNAVSSVRNELLDLLGVYFYIPSIFPSECAMPLTTISSTATFASTLLSLSYFLIGLSILSYGLSIIAVGETLMFVIFKKKSDDDDIITRMDEDEIENDMDNEFTFDEGMDDSSGQQNLSSSTEPDSNQEEE